MDYGNSALSGAARQLDQSASNQKSIYVEKPDKQPELDLIEQRLENIGATLDQTRATLGTKADHVFGTRPPTPECGTAGNSPIPSGRIAQLGASLDALDRLASELSVQADRFTRL